MKTGKKLHAGHQHLLEVLDLWSWNDRDGEPRVTHAKDVTLQRGLQEALRGGVSLSTTKRWLHELDEAGFIDIRTSKVPGGWHGKASHHVTYRRIRVISALIPADDLGLVRGRTEAEPLRATSVQFSDWVGRHRGQDIDLRALAGKLGVNANTLRSAAMRWSSKKTRATKVSRWVYRFDPVVVASAQAATSQSSPASIHAAAAPTPKQEVKPVVEVQPQAPQQEVSGEQRVAELRAWVQEQAHGSLDELHAMALEDDRTLTAIRRQEAGEEDHQSHGAAGLPLIPEPQLSEAEQREAERRLRCAQHMAKNKSVQETIWEAREAREEARRQQLAEERQRQLDWVVSVELERRGMRRASPHVPSFPQPVDT